MIYASYRPSQRASVLYEGLIHAIQGSTSKAQKELRPDEIILLGQQSGLTPWLLDLLTEHATEVDVKSLHSNYLRLAKIALSRQQEAFLIANRALSDNNIYCAALKGIIYPSNLKSYTPILLNDIDIIVNKSSIDLVKKMLIESGFTQNFVSHDNKIQPVGNDSISEFEEKHYELFPFTKVVRADEADSLASTISRLGITHPFVVENGNVYVAVELDVHHNLSIGLDAERILSGVESRIVGGESVSALDWETHIWFLSARIYHEVMVLGTTKIRPLVDLAKICHLQSIDWERVVDTAYAYTLSPGIYYSLSFLRDAFSVDIPDWVLEKLNLDRVVNGRLHDFGDFVSKALGDSVLIRPEPISNNVIDCK